MTKEKIKNKNPQMSAFESQLNLLLKFGNHAKIRKIAKGVLPSGDREIADNVITHLEPKPLVFWIGVGSVALATVIALLLTR